MQILARCIAVLFMVCLPILAQSARTTNLDMRSFGLVKASCARYEGTVDFLDDEHLVIYAPTTSSCSGKAKEWSFRHRLSTPIEARLTVIDLAGKVTASIKRADFVEFSNGPLGHVRVCTDKGIEVLSESLQLVRSLPHSNDGLFPCLMGPLSPSRNRFLTYGPGKHEYSLFTAESETPVETITTEEHTRMERPADSGFVVCREVLKQCEVRQAQGISAQFPMPKFSGSGGFQKVGMVQPDRMLLASFDGRRLEALSSSGEAASAGDVASMRPPFVNSIHVELSALQPRRILYAVDGCLLGDYDDCYGVVFRRFAVFDSASSKELLRDTFAPHASLKLSPNGRTVLEQDGYTVKLYRLP